MRQKRSMPSTIARVVNGRHRLDDARRRASNARAAALHRVARPRRRAAGPSRRRAAGRCAGPSRRRSRSSQSMSWQRQARRVAPVGPAQRRHQQRGVAHRARHRPGHAADVGRLDRHAAEARLEADHAAPAGRQADRAADVGAEVQRAVAGGGRGAGAGAAAAGVLASGPTGCAPAGGSSTAPTTACRSRASSSCRRSPRRPRAGAPPAARRPAAGTSVVAALPSGIGTPRVAMFSLIVTGTPSSADAARRRASALGCRAPCRQRARRHRARRWRAAAARSARCAPARACTTSTGDASRARYSPASSPARRARAVQPLPPTSLPRHRRHVVGGDRRAGPQALQALLRHRHLSRVEDEDVDRVGGEHLLQVAEQLGALLRVARRRVSAPPGRGTPCCRSPSSTACWRTACSPAARRGR